MVRPPSIQCWAELMTPDEDDQAIPAEPFVYLSHRRGPGGLQTTSRHQPTHRYSGGWPDDDEDDDEDEDAELDSDATRGYPAEVESMSNHSIDEDEYDGAVPRPLIVDNDNDNDESMEDTDDEYGGSFIDDGEEDEEGYDLESTGSLRDGEEDDDFVVASASDEDQEQEQAPDNPTLEELRVRRQAALVHPRE